MSETVTGHVIESLAYGFTGAIVGLLCAVVVLLVQRIRGRPGYFSSVVNWMWGIVLVIVIGGKVVRYLAKGAEAVV